MRYKAIIFDLDGTLVNSLEDLGGSVNAMLRSYGFPEYKIDEYKYLTGNGSQKLIERVLPEGKEELLEEALAKYKAIYQQHFCDKTAPYPGIKEMLSQARARKLPLAICTNKHQEAARAVVSKLFPADTFQMVVGNYPGSKCKPDTGNVLRIASELGVKPQETAYLGDSWVDMETATRAGFLPIGVLWGFRSREELVENGAKVLLETPAELWDKVDFA